MGGAVATLGGRIVGQHDAAIVGPRRKGEVVLHRRPGPVQGARFDDVDIDEIFVAAHPRPAGAEIEIERRGLGMPFFPRSEEHTSELQSLMRISYAVFCLKKKKYT